MAALGQAGSMTPAQFVAKWRPVELAERAASQEHFLDLCRLLGQPTPAETDAVGAEYTFEKSVPVTGAASAARTSYGPAKAPARERTDHESSTGRKVGSRLM